jgi:hypothetical protein
MPVRIDFAAMQAVPSTKKRCDSRIARRSDRRDETVMPSTNTVANEPLVSRLRARKATRRRREIALLALSLVLVVAALAFDQAALILLAVFPALASYGQR